MKTKYLLILALALSASCGKERTVGREGIPMQVAAILADDTKAYVTAADVTDFYLQVSCEDDTYSYFTHVTLGTDGAWHPDEPMYWKNETTPVTYSAVFFSGHAFTAASFANGIDLNFTDDVLMAAPVTVKFTETTGGQLDIVLKHALVKLRLEFTLGEKFFDSGIGLAESPVTLPTLADVPVFCHFTPASGEFTPDTGYMIPLLLPFVSYTPGTAGSKAAKAVYESSVLPGTYAPGTLTLTFRIGPGEYTWTNNKTITFVSGEVVTLPVSVMTPFV